MNHLYKRILSRKNVWIPLLVLVFVVGFALRTYEFGDQLVFKSDQARDALIMNNADISIFKSLLLGAQVGGTGLRLGPIHYYFQFISSKIFGASPESFAYPDLLWGILTLPLLFILARKYFQVYISLWIVALASCSLFLITFARFSWNPNGLPFFTTLFAILFLNALETKGARRLRMLGFAAAVVGIIAQLHLMAILAFGLGIVIFLIITKALNWKEIIFAAAIIFAMQFPMILNEIKTGGENYGSFSDAVEKKSEPQKSHNIAEKVFKAYQSSSNIFWLVSTGNQNNDEILTRGFSFKCDKACKSELPYSLSAMLLLLLAVYLIYLTWHQSKDDKEKIKIIFLLSWLASFFIISIILAYQLETRFFLSVIVLFYIALGFLAQRVMIVSKNTRIKVVIVMIGIFMIGLNLKASLSYLHDLSSSRVSSKESGRDLRFGTAPKVTLSQMRDIASEAKKRFTQNEHVIVSGESMYVKAMYYLLSAENGFEGCYVHGNAEKIPAGYNNLIISYSKTSDDAESDGGELSFEKFGTLSASFEKAEGNVDFSESMPKKCLTY